MIKNYIESFIGDIERNRTILDHYFIKKFQINNNHILILISNFGNDAEVIVYPDHLHFHDQVLKGDFLWNLMDKIIVQSITKYLGRIETLCDEALLVVESVYAIKNNYFITNNNYILKLGIQNNSLITESISSRLSTRTNHKKLVCDGSNAILYRNDICPIKDEKNKRLILIGTTIDCLPDLKFSDSIYMEAQTTLNAMIDNEYALLFTNKQIKDRDQIVFCVLRVNISNRNIETLFEAVSFKEEVIKVFRISNHIFILTDVKNCYLLGLRDFSFKKVLGDNQIINILSEGVDLFSNPDGFLSLKNKKELGTLHLISYSSEMNSLRELSFAFSESCPDQLILHNRNNVIKFSRTKIELLKHQNFMNFMVTD